MNQFQHQQPQIQPNMSIGSGLTRYRSAPSSFFDSFLNNDDDLEQLLNPRICSPETQKIFARFMSSGDNNPENCSQNPPIQSQPQLNPPFPAPIKDEPDAKRPRPPLNRQKSKDYSSVREVMYQSGDLEDSNTDIKSSFDRLISSMDPNRGARVKVEGSSLIRHSSSPAGLFDSINIEEFGAMRGIENFGAGNDANRDASFSSASRFKNNQKDLPPRTPSSSAKMAPISKGIGENSPIAGQFDEKRGNDGDYVSDFPLNQWDDSILSDDFLKGLVEDVDKTFPKANVSDDQNNECGNRTRLTHHLSLPTNSSAMEKLLQDSVPCKLRAKRGFATHPRSIAERVRRTKISDRIRKLQELVPNMDKQTNTADMLDLAVDYIKELQKQVKTLSDNDAKCGCSAKSNH